MATEVAAFKAAMRWSMKGSIYMAKKRSRELPNSREFLKFNKESSWEVGSSREHFTKFELLGVVSSGEVGVPGSGEVGAPGSYKLGAPGSWEL